jgi:transcriptional regulator
MNSSPTATTTLGFKHSNESKKIISEKAQQRENKHLKKFHFKKGDKNPFEGQNHTKETIEKLKRIASTRTYKTGGHNKGIPMREDVKLKVSKSVSQNRRVYSDEVEQKVKELRNQGWTLQRISEELGVSISQASRMAKGQRAHYKLKYEVKE